MQCANLFTVLGSLQVLVGYIHDGSLFEQGSDECVEKFAFCKVTGNINTIISKPI